MVDALVLIALEKLDEVVGQQLSLFAGAARELQKVSSTFRSIRPVLADAESWQVGDRNVKLWLSRLKHVAYDVEDLVEDGRISGLGDQEGNEDDGNRRKKARLWFAFAYDLLGHAVSRYKIARDIKEIRERLEEIDVERNKFGFSSSTPGGDDRRPVVSERLTTPFMDESELFIGRENDKETIIGKLVSGGSLEDPGRVQVVAVVGIGGLGKTALARQIYNDHTVRNHFEALYWVCVSETFDVIKLVKEIIEEVKNASTALLGLNPLQRKLLEALQGKRFLLVLDDVWNDDAEKWNMLWLPLNSGAQGSRILVTTRGQKVACTMNAAFIHELKGLSDYHSLELFRSRAFAGRTSEEYSKLENVGREIVSKCRGVPFAIMVMGSAMSSKRTMADWKNILHMADGQNILDSEMWSLLEAENNILPALWPSYYNLPLQLKQCFVYCSMFPKDWVLEKDMLVRLWVAQGFIRPKGNRHIEDIGADYFDDLVAWSMFQEVKKHSKGKITYKITYKMHDLLHDLAEFVATDEIYTFIEKPEQCPIASSNIRHSFLFFTGRPDEKFNKISIALGRATKLRTLFLHRLYRIEKCIVDIFRQARFVRALVFSGFSSRTVRRRSAIVELLKAIGDMKHLRYLDLSGLDIAELPESVSYLRSLHTLNLSNCGKLIKLPRGIGRMVSLRHLEIEGTESLKCLPKGLGRISGLRSLSKFIVGGGDEGEGCGIDELQPLNSLQGTLKIQHLERVSSREEAEKAELWNKQYLCSLVLDVSGKKDDDAEIGADMSGKTDDDDGDGDGDAEIGTEEDDDNDNDAETGTIDSVLEGLRPHENLEELQLNMFTGSKLPSWMDEKRRLRKLVLGSGSILKRVPHLPNLKEFQIGGVRNEMLPDEGWEQLVALQDLRIRFCRELKCLPKGLTQLPSLEKLGIRGCDNLESLPEGLGQLKKLKTLKIGYLNALGCLPDSVGQLESLEYFHIWSCKKLESLPNSLGHLKKLNILEVGGLEVLRCLPDWVGQLESLDILHIYDLKNLESLPDSLGEKLSRLDIEDCGALASLPQQGLRHLSWLSISNCPLLEKRYKREGGVDWPNISHIRTIYINAQWIQ